MEFLKLKTLDQIRGETNSVDCAGDVVFTEESGMPIIVGGMIENFGKVIPVEKVSKEIYKSKDRWIYHHAWFETPSKKEVQTEISDKEFDMMLDLFKVAHRDNLGDLYEKKEAYETIRDFLKDAGYIDQFHSSTLYNTTKRIFDTLFSSAGYHLSW